MADVQDDATLKAEIKEQDAAGAAEVAEEPDAKRARVEDDTTAAAAAAVPDAEKKGDAAAAPEDDKEQAPPAEKSAPKEPVTIGYKSFSTGNECFKYYSNIMSKYRKNQDLNEYELHNVLELIRLGHPEAERKLSGNVVAVQIRDMYTNGQQSSCFHLVRANGTTEDVSYRKCISNLFDDMKFLMDSKPNRGHSGGKGRGGGRGGGRGRGGRGGRR